MTNTSEIEKPWARVSFWTKCIGGLELIVYTLIWKTIFHIGQDTGSFGSAAKPSGFTLFRRVYINLFEYEDHLSSSLEFVGIFVAFFTNQLVIGGMLMAVVLLKGAYSKKPLLLLGWMIYTIISLLIGMIIDVIEVFVVFSTHKVIFVTVMLVCKGVFLWVVGKYRQQLLLASAN